ncbi:MAG: hypothetical protein ABIP12_04030, partial [Terriglobales bacterium]
MRLKKPNARHTRCAGTHTFPRISGRHAAEREHGPIPGGGTGFAKTRKACDAACVFFKYVFFKYGTKHGEVRALRSRRYNFLARVAGDANDRRRQASLPEKRLRSGDIGMVSRQMHAIRTCGNSNGNAGIDEQPGAG